MNILLNIWDQVCNLLGFNFKNVHIYLLATHTPQLDNRYFFYYFGTGNIYVMLQDIGIRKLPTLIFWFFASQCHGHLIFLTMNSVRSKNQNFKYQRLTISGCKNVEIKKLEIWWLIN